MSVASKSIQDRINELNKLVEWFDSDDFSLEAALGKFKSAEKLAQEIEHDLNNLKNEITIVKQKFDNGD
ncbi:exodeoxyribonuclease VII small subunit [Candidatus Saccharibacteria bacterium]|nr:exodeoxyribonuclease VII small subunit [Candidatus Saccharibacteria bacterium]